MNTRRFLGSHPIVQKIDEQKLKFILKKHVHRIIFTPLYFAYVPIPLKLIETASLRRKKAAPPQLLEKKATAEKPSTPKESLILRLVVPAGKPLYLVTDTTVKLDSLLESVATVIGKAASPKWKRLSPPNQDQVALKSISYHDKSGLKSIVTEADWRRCLSKNIDDQMKISLFVSMRSS